MSEFSSHFAVKIPSNKSFGITFAIITFILAVISFKFGNGKLWYLFIASPVMLFLAVVFPRILYYPNLLWFKFGLLLHKIISPIMMTIVYIFTILPTAFVFLLLRKTLITRWFISKRITHKTNWQDRKKQQPQSMHRLF